MTVFVCSIREYWPTVDLRLVEPRSLPSDLTERGSEPDGSSSLRRGLEDVDHGGRFVVTNM